MIFEGTVHKYGRDVDTDVIIPARYLNTNDPQELASHAMEDIDADFVDRVQPGDIIVAEENFGCGSSREHAPVAIKVAGVSVVVASSFARIFYRNAINTGLPIVVCPAAAADAKMGDRLKVDLAAGTVENLTQGKTYDSEAFPPFMQELIDQGGLLPVREVPARRRERLVTTPANLRGYRVMTLPGDGVGPEIVDAAKRVLDAAGEKFGYLLAYEVGVMGGCAIDQFGTPMEDGLIERCQATDAVLLGAVGGPKWDTTDPDKPRPEQGLLGMRKGLELFANLRPVKSFKALAHNSTLKPEVIDGVDMLVVRELTGGVYFGKRERTADTAYDTMIYTEAEVDRLMEYAFKVAGGRRKLVHSVDKANVLESSRLWRAVAIRVAERYPDVEMRHMLVDNCAMQFIRDPKQFDVVATENLFGDVLSDEAAMLTGSIGMLPSASVGAGGVSLYEPIHGSAPDIAGKGLANPCATILSAAMMLDLSFEERDAARAVERAVETALEQGARTADIAGPGEKTLTTTEMTDAILAAL